MRGSVIIGSVDIIVLNTRSQSLKLLHQNFNTGSTLSSSNQTRGNSGSLK